MAVGDQYFYLCAASLWVAGLAISVFGGWPIVHGFMKKLEKRAKLPDKDETKSVPRVWTGWIERAFFTGWVGLMGLEHTVGIGALAWLGLKLASNWHRRRTGGEDKEKANEQNQDKEIEIITRTWVALLSGLVSVTWAILIGTTLWHGLRITD